MFHASASVWAHVCIMVTYWIYPRALFAPVQWGPWGPHLSSQTVLPGMATLILIGSHHHPPRRPPPPRWEDGSLVRSRFGGGLKIKDREVRAWFYWWAVDVLGVCAALKPWHTEWCAGRGHMHTRSYEHVDSGSFKLLRGICMCFVTLHNFVCVCVGGGCVSSSFLGSEPL